MENYSSFFARLFKNVGLNKCSLNYQLKLNLKRALLLTIVFVSLSVNACDGSYAHLDINELHRRADLVVKGTVTNVSTYEDARHYYLEAKIEVEKYLKNPFEEAHFAPPLRITVQSSEVKMYEGIWYETPPLVNFTVGEKVIVYLEKTGTEVYSPVGAKQGKFTLMGNSYVNSGGEIIREPNPFSSLIVGLIIIGAFALVIDRARRLHQ